MKIVRAKAEQCGSERGMRSNRCELRAAGGGAEGQVAKENFRDGREVRALGGTYLLRFAGSRLIFRMRISIVNEPVILHESCRAVAEDLSMRYVVTAKMTEV